MSEEAEPKETVRHEVPRVVEALTTVPWAITKEALDTIVAIATRENVVTQEALEAYRAKRVAGTEGLQVRPGGVGIISIAGPLFRRSDLFSAISGAATYESIAKDLKAAEDMPEIRSLLLGWDSPGGEVNGVAELAAMVRALAIKMPVESYVSGQCCSAAYWVASASSKVTIASTAMMGSIGVRLGIRDASERDAKSGVKTIEFISSNAPNKKTDWSTDDGRAKIQKTADQLEAVFLADVAKYRGISVDEVIAKFGQGGVEIGQDAVTAGLADAIGSFESTLARLAGGSGRVVVSQPRSTAMSTETAPANQPAKTFTQAELDAAVATASSNAQTAASARIAAIVDSEEGKKRPTLARHLAFNTSMDAAAAEGMLKAAAVETAPNASADAPNPPANTNQQKPNGERSQDAAGGLALATVTEGKNGGKEEQPKPAAINTGAIYANRAKAMGQRQ